MYKSIYILDSNFEGIQDMKSELWNSICVTHYNHICTKWYWQNSIQLYLRFQPIEMLVLRCVLVLYVWMMVQQRLQHNMKLLSWYRISLFRYGFSLKIQSRHKLDPPNWRTLPDPLWSPITILGTAHGPCKIRQFCGQIHDLLEK